MLRFLLLLVSLPFLTASTAPSDHPEPVAYTLTPEIGEGGLVALNVSVRFRLDASGNAIFGWRDGWSGERELWQWSRNLRVEGATHRPEGNGRWRVTGKAGDVVTARYRIVSAHESDPTIGTSEQSHPVIRPDWFYGVGYTLFARPEGSDARPATFEWKGAPEGFGFASDLEHLDKSGASGTVSDIVESISIGGRNLRLFAPSGGDGIRVATIGRYAFGPQALDKLSRNIIGAHREFWDADRGRPFLVTAIPLIGAPGQISYSGTGLGDAFALWIDQNAPLDMMRGLLSHEYLHGWIPRRLGNIPSDREARASLFWLSEGFTDYYARALLVRNGQISTAQFVDQWNDVLRAYTMSPAHNLSGADAAQAFWDNPAAQQLAYQRGALLAARWNARLRTSTDGKTGLDEVLRAQIVTAQDDARDPSTLLVALLAARGVDVTADIDRHIVRGDTIELEMADFGRCAIVTTKRMPTFARGFDADQTAANDNRVTGIDPASPAYAAGLRNDMRILGLSEGETGNPLVHYALDVDDNGTKKTIRFLPQGVDRIDVQQLRLTRHQPDCAESLGGEVTPPANYNRS